MRTLIKRTSVKFLLLVGIVAIKREREREKLRFMNTHLNPSMIIINLLLSLLE